KINVYGDRVGIGRIEVRNLTQRPPKVGERLILSLSFGCFPHVKQMINSNSIQPRAKQALTAEGAELGHRFNENLLRGVLRDNASPDHSHRKIEDPRLMASDKFIERPGVPGNSAGNKPLVWRDSVRCVQSDKGIC